jgi:AcrR family transcriptional regulator
VSAVRRTQLERSTSTQALLVATAVDSLVERGWAATTAVEVCARAGVTRGALVHHFGGLPGLLAAALQSVYDEHALTPPTPGATVVDLIDAAWRVLSGPHTKAMLEAWLAMANDPELAADVGPVVACFAELVNPGNLPVAVLDDPACRSWYLMARESLLGLALGRATNGGHPLGHEDAVLAQLRAGAPTPA